MNTQPVAHGLDQYGPLLNASEFARVLGVSLGQFNKNRRLGDYARFETQPALGHRRYSKSLITRWLSGERIDEPSRVFGRKAR